MKAKNLKINDIELVVFENGDVFRKSDNKKIKFYTRGKYGSKRGGYKSASINRKTTYLHRLLAKAFIPNPENKPCVNHIDGNGENNSVSNLEWSTYSENNQHAYDAGLKNHKKRLAGFCYENCQVYRFESVKEAISVTGLNKTTIHRALSGVVKNPSEWMFQYLS